MKGRVVDCKDCDEGRAECEEGGNYNERIRYMVQVVRDVNEGRVKGLKWTYFIPICTVGHWGVVVAYVLDGDDAK